MKKISLITIGITTVVLLLGCSRVRRSPGRVYMPDMNYSRAYETYASIEQLKAKYPDINYNALPVTGTIARGDMTWVYPYKNDTTGYAQSASVKNPLTQDSLYADFLSATTNKKEAERLYLVYCGICHGTKLDGNGPLFTSGVFTAAPKNFMADDMKKMSEGTMFHSVTYGKNAMGSYASQLNTMQRWMVIEYIKSKQGGTVDTANAKPPADTVKKNN